MREIREKNQENLQLDEKARKLQQNVESRKQIMSLKSKTSNESENDPKKKIKEVANQRKLKDVIK